MTSKHDYLLRELDNTAKRVAMHAEHNPNYTDNRLEHRAAAAIRALEAEKDAANSIALKDTTEAIGERKRAESAETERDQFRNSLSKLAAKHATAIAERDDLKTQVSDLIWADKSEALKMEYDKLWSEKEAAKTERDEARAAVADGAPARGVEPRGRELQPR